MWRKVYGALTLVNAQGMFLLKALVRLRPALFTYSSVRSMFDVQMPHGGSRIDDSP